MEEKTKSHIVCSISDTDLFTPAFLQRDIEKGFYEEFYPLSKLEDNGAVEFSIENSTEKFIDLANSYIKLKFKVVNGDNTNLADADKVTFINYPVATLFSQIDISLGGSIISSSTNTYGYRSFIETLLNYGKEAKETQLALGLYTKDTARKLDVTDPAGENKGLKDRFDYCKNSKVVTVCGRIHSDLFNQGRLLLNGLPLKITFHRQKDSFVLMKQDGNGKVKLLDVVLNMRKVNLTPHKFKEIQQTLEKISIMYPITRVDLKTHSVAAGLTSLNWDNAVLGQIPNRIFVGLVDNDAFTGAFNKNPLNFRHYNLSSIAAYVNGESQPGNPIKLNFANGDYVDGYRSLFTATGKINRDEGIHIERRDYSGGYSLVGFDLSPALCNGAHQDYKKTGTLRLSLEFKRALAGSITAILFCEFDNVITVNKSRNILKDY